MDRCPVCDPSCQYAQPTGPLPCDMLLIGEKPGQEEAYRHKVFVGDTGKEMEGLYLLLAGLQRPEVRVTNAVKCRLGNNNNKPTPKQVAACAAHHLPGEIEACRPSLIILAGSTACSLVPKIELEKQHGYPVWCAEDDSEFFGGWEGWVWPSFHPAAGLHETGMMIPLTDDFARLGQWLKGKWKPPKPVESTGRYRLIAERKDAIFFHPSDTCLAVDTENDGPHPWSIQFSPMAGSAFLIKANNAAMVEWFRCYVANHCQELILHHAVHDLDVLDKLGIHPRRYRDTMQEAYQLGNQPQGLKALAYRLLGVKMRSWEEVAGPPSRLKMIEWLTRAWDWLSDDRERVTIKLKTKTRILWKPTPAEQDVKRILKHAVKPEYDIWEKAEEAGLLGEGILAEAIAEKCGPHPIMSIANASLAEAVEYACQDADITGRIAAVLERERGRIVEQEWKVSEGDYDL